MAPLDVVVTRWDVVEPDLLFVATGQEAIVTDRNIQGAPALVVEIASPGTRRRDEQAKRQLFDRGGVREYWIVGPDFNVVRIFRRHTDGPFRPETEIAGENVLTTPLLPGFELRVAALFA
jgi:Uma2 family endonuclease